MKTTILVTGGAGFIGSHINQMLQSAGYETVVLDNLSRGNRSSVSGQFIEGDIADSDLLKAIFNKFHIDAVMHFAAYIDVGESVKHPALYYQNNVSGTLNLLNAMVNANVSNFVFSSTAAIYGHPITEKISENHPALPINPYGESKWMIEKILSSFEASYGLRFCSLRYFNAAGGNPQGKTHHPQNRCSNLIPVILRTLIDKQKKVTIFGNDYATRDGTCIRDYIHIADLGHAHIMALEKLLQGAKGNFYNLGNGNGFSVIEVIEAVEQALKKNVDKTFGDRRPGDPPILIADATKALNELNWQPKYSLDEMIVHAWQGMTHGKN